MSQFKIRNEEDIAFLAVDEITPRKSAEPIFKVTFVYKDGLEVPESYECCSIDVACRRATLFADGRHDIKLRLQPFDGRR